MTSVVVPASGMSAQALGWHHSIRAACRALETRRRIPQTRDPHAALLVSAVGEAHSVELMGMSPGRQLDGDGRKRLRLTLEGRSVHDRFFDEYALAAVQAGIRQVVIVLAGLDTRAYRLRWPEGTVVYEVNDPSILDLRGCVLSDPLWDFKDQVLAEAGIRPNVRRAAVVTSLNGSWHSALTASGFDPEMPTAWLIETPTTFLPVHAQDQLFEGIVELSASGSRLVVEDQYPNHHGRSLIDVTPAGMRCGRFPLIEQLHNRTSPAQWLSGHGWLTKTIAVSDLSIRYRRPTPHPVPRRHPCSRTDELDVLSQVLQARKHLVCARLPTDYTSASTIVRVKPINNGLDF